MITMLFHITFRFLLPATAVAAASDVGHRYGWGLAVSIGILVCLLSMFYAFLHDWFGEWRARLATRE